LLGLLFVVIFLSAERGRKDAPRIRTYLTPTAIYFSSVLLIGALLAIPNQTRLTDLICVCLGGIFGVVTAGRWHSGEVPMSPFTTVPTLSHMFSCRLPTP
jgi:hypothetical protein